MRWCWVNFQCMGRPTIWIIVGQGSTALAVGAGGGCLDIFTLICSFSPLSPSLWETARYRLKYCLKGPLNPKQPTNRLQSSNISYLHIRTVPLWTELLCYYALNTHSFLHVGISELYTLYVHACILMRQQ